VRGAAGLPPRRGAPNVTFMPRRDPFDEPEEDLPEPTARPSERLRHDRAEEEDEKLVPLGNVGGAAPTALGLDSGGNLPGSEDDLANLSEPEPPEPPEVGAVHVRDHDDPASPRRR
jgi:hypothetical protein